MRSAKHYNIIHCYVEAYNAFDVDGMTIDLHPDIRFTNITNGEVSQETNGLDAFRAQAEKAKEYFEERNQKITAVRFTENKAEADIDYSATLAMDFPNGLKAGDKIGMKGKSVFEFKGDKIIALTDIS